MPNTIDYKFERLEFRDKIDYVIIGVNRINKKTYLDHKDTFDRIIEAGDTAWNNSIHATELIQFVKYLDENKTNLQLCNNNNGQSS